MSVNRSRGWPASPRAKKPLFLRKMARGGSPPKGSRDTPQQPERLGSVQASRGCGARQEVLKSAGCIPEGEIVPQHKNPRRFTPEGGGSQVVPCRLR